METPLIIVVTGSNRGIGRGIVQLLASTQHARPLSIHATSRSGTELQITPWHSNTISYSKLDISSPSSLSEFLHNFIKQDTPIDVLINNAGINNNSSETPDLAEDVINLNYHATKTMCLSFLQQGRMSKNPNARIVNISSTASTLANYTPALQAQFRGAKSVSDIDALASSYLRALRSGPQAQEKGGWGTGPRSYQVSKACVNALTVVLARMYAGVSVNCCCPGWVDTEMGWQVGRPVKTEEEGARIPVRLAVGELGIKGDEDGGLGGEGLKTKTMERVSGRYFGNDGVGDTGWGRVREW